MVIFIGIVALIFSGLVALYTNRVAQYTKEVARCTREYTTETRRLWEITQNSYFVRAATRYLFDKYYKHIEEWPSDPDVWIPWLNWPPPENERPQIFRDDCTRVLLEKLFPDIKKVEEIGIKGLQKEGYKFKGET